MEIMIRRLIRRLLTLVIYSVTLNSNNAYAQSFSFYHTYTENSKLPPSFDLQETESGFYIFFKAVNGNMRENTYKKVFLGHNLEPLDSVEYIIEGQSDLISIHHNYKFDFYVFYTKLNLLSNKNEELIFLITDKQGKEVSRFSKTRSDFFSYFKRKEHSRLSSMTLSIFDSDDLPELLIFRPIAHVDYNEVYPEVGGSIVAVDALSGNEMWRYPISAMPVTTSLADNNTLVLIINVTNILNPKYEMHFVDKLTGKTFSIIPLNELSKFNVVTALASNGAELLTTGINFETRYEKNPKLFVSKFDFHGERLLFKEELIPEFQNKSIHFIGLRFDEKNNICLIGAVWKYNPLGEAIGDAILEATYNLSRGILSGSYTWSSDYFLVLSSSTETGALVTTENLENIEGSISGEFVISGNRLIVKLPGTILVYDLENTHNAPKFIYREVTLFEMLFVCPSGLIFIKRNQNQTSLELKTFDGN